MQVIQELVDAGADWIQLEEPSFTKNLAEEDSEEESEEDESFKNKVVVDVEAISTNAASEN